jgi:hypothetical protein
MTSTVRGSDNFDSAQQGIKLQAAVTLSGQTEIIFSGIPTWAARITVALEAVQLSAGDLLVQIGPTAGAEVSGYRAGAHVMAGTNTVTSRNSTAGFIVLNPTSSNFGDVIVTLVRVTGNRWISGHQGDWTGWGSTGGGRKSLSAALAVVRIAPTSGVLSTGAISISYEG